MKTIELGRLLLDQAPYHRVTVDLDGFECEIVDVRAVGQGEVQVDADLPEGYRMLPDEPSDDMLGACVSLGYPPAALRLMWATMIRAHDEENE